MISFFLTLAALPALPETCETTFEALRAEGAVDAAYVAHVGFARADPGDGRLRWFLIDTGANRSALDAGVARDLGLAEGAQTVVEGSAGVIRTATTVIERFRLGAVETALSPTVSDLSGLIGPGGEPVAGILGSDLFGAHVLMFDFERSRVALTAPGERLDQAAACGRSVGFTADKGIPRLTARVDGRDIALRYDSGAAIFDSPHLWFNVTERQFAMITAGRDPGDPVATLGASGVGGTLSLQAWAAGELHIGELRWTEARMIRQPAQGYFAREDAVGFVGNSAFRPYGLVIVDYARGRLIVPPAQQPAQSPRPPSSS